MTATNEEPKAESQPAGKTGNTFDTTLYTNRFEEAVLDAQLMLEYAASNTISVIDPGTVRKLIAARQSIESGEWVSHKDDITTLKRHDCDLRAA